MSNQSSILFSFSELDNSPVLRKLDGRITGRSHSKRVTVVSKPVFKSFAGKVWRERPVSDVVYKGLLDKQMDPHLASVFSRRVSDLDAMLAALNPKLCDLDSPFLLPDIEAGCNALADVVARGGRIGLVCDFDADGMNSAAVLFSALIDYFNVPADCVDVYIGQRLTEGYGLSDKLVDRILNEEKVPEIIITADCGSSDEARIARLKQLGISVIVTDHHTLPLAGYPASAVACITPLRADSAYPDPKIAGCMVAWLFMSALRQTFINNGRIPKESPSLRDLLDFVALATVADCVSLGDSKNNRAVVNYGLRLINNNARPCWRALREYIGGNDEFVTSETLAFKIAPRLNARGRLNDAMTGVDFLLCENEQAARSFAALLDEENQNRKAIEREMARVAVEAASEQIEASMDGIVVYLEDGHPGVHGIVASRITEKMGKPTIMLSPTVGNELPDGDRELSGSCRSVDGVDVKEALQYVADRAPEIFVKFGGHHGAAGLTTHLRHLDKLKALFHEAVRAQAKGRTLLPALHTDGVLDFAHISLDFVDNIMRAAPFGNGFSYPIYEGDLYVESVKPVGQDQCTMKVLLTDGRRAFNGIWFGARDTADAPIPVEVGMGYRFAFSVTENNYRGSSTVQLQIVDAMDRGIR